MARKAPRPRGADEQHGGAQPATSACHRVPHDHQHQQRVDPERPCGARPARQRGGDGRHRQHRPHAVQPAGGHGVEGRAVDGARVSSGPRTCGANRTDSSSATDDRHGGGEDDRGRACRRAPNSQRGNNMKLAPRKAATAPDRGGDRVHRDHLFARHHVRQRRRQPGRDEAGEAVDDQRADTGSPRRRRRPPAACRRNDAQHSRARFAPTSTSAGPTGPAARRRTGPAASTAGTAPRMPARSPTGSAARSGLNSRAPAKPAWNSPSPNWLATRSSSSRRNSGSARTDRHSAAGARAHPGANH